MRGDTFSCCGTLLCRTAVQSRTSSWQRDAAHHQQPRAMGYVLLCVRQLSCCLYSHRVWLFRTQFIHLPVTPLTSSESRPLLTDYHSINDPSIRVRVPSAYITRPQRTACGPQPLTGREEGYPRQGRG